VAAELPALLSCLPALLQCSAGAASAALPLLPVRRLPVRASLLLCCWLLPLLLLLLLLLSAARAAPRRLY
jgi:hypothetical protein